MKRLFLQNVLMAIAIVFFYAQFSAVQASHIPGANITYACNPANPLEYTFTLTVFRKCPGTHPATMSGTYLTLTNDCGLTNPVVPTFNQVGTAQDVNQLCNTATSNCSGGSDPGVWMYTYEGTITLPANCDGWHMEYSLCCRDASSNLSGGSGNTMVTYTTLNTLTSPCNNSPVVTAQPIPYACTNTNFNYCLTAFDPEGDSISYSMVAPMTTGQAPIAHLAGFSPTAPLNNFSINPQTGCLSLNHPTAGNYVVAIMIREWDNAGNLVSEIIHDFQIMVISCSNTPPTNPSGGISNFVGTGTQTGPQNIAVCFGNTVCFDVVFQDLADPLDNLTITTDGTTLLPGATFVQTGNNPVRGTFCWTAQPGFLNDVITFNAEDDGCPVMGITGFAVDFDITPGVFAGPDVTICGSQTAQLQATNSTAFTWAPPTGLSCTNCSNPVASPAATTTYTVTGNLTGACSNTDQVTVYVVPDFPLNTTPAAPTICANELVQINANAGAGGAPYIFAWDNGATLNDDSIASPIANPLLTTNYHVTVTSSLGCVKQDSIEVTVSGVGPTVTINPVDTTLCPGESVTLTANSANLPVVCGISSGCTGSTQTITAGTQTTNSTTYSPFYGSTSATANGRKRTQYIFTAAELNAMGIQGGTIRDLAVFSTTTNAYVYNAEIWLGCTAQDQFTNADFISATTMTQVFGPVMNINPTDNGWTTFNIVDYDWDGTSNLIVQICTEETGTSGSQTGQGSSTAPAYRYMQYATTSTTITPCTNPTGSRYTVRPNMRFNFCQQGVSAPAYSWSPGATLSSTTIQSPLASPTTTTTYLVNVTDGVSGCTGSALVNVDVHDLAMTMNPAGPVNMCAGDPATTISGQLWENGVQVGNGSTGPYNEAANGAMPMCSNVTGGDHTVTFNNGVPDAFGNVTFTICMDGDFGSTSETFTVFGEGGVNLGTYSQSTATPASSQGDCNATPFCNTVTITQAQWNAWNTDNQVVFTIDVSTSVNNFCSVGGGTGGTVASCVTSAVVDYTSSTGTSYAWSPAAGLSDPTIQSPDASPAASTTYTVTSVYKGCTIDNTVDFVVNTPSTAPSLSPVLGSMCPNTTMTLTAGGGTAGVGSSIEWYTGPNGTGTWLGSGNSYSFIPTNGETIYIRREGACNNTADDSETIAVKDYIYGLNGNNTTTYCTDNANWHHFYNGNDILLSIRGDLSLIPAGYPQVTIWENGAGWYQQTQGPFTPADCATNGLTPGEERFEMERSWNVDLGGGTPVGTYDVRFYYDPAERTAIENAAATHMATYAACGYTYKYGNPQGFYWFKNTGANYTAPDYDGTHLTATGGSTPNATNYAEITGVTSFSGGSGAVILVPTTLLPVQWLYFDGETDNKTNFLRWATESEQNSDFINIQRSQDGINFMTIGTTPAQGNSTTTTHYTYDDVNPFEGVNYYRLELVDLDGKTSYSNTIMLVIASDDLGYNFYPNPTNDVVFYQYEASEKESLKIEVLDVLGKQVVTQEVTSTIGTNNIPVDLSTFPAGSYMVRVHNNKNGAVHTAKVIKNKF